MAAGLVAPALVVVTGRLTLVDVPPPPAVVVYE
jgi:hypothetical protein